MKPEINTLRPVRKIRPSSLSITGKRSSQKTGTNHQFESTLERDYLTLLEFDEAVESYMVQPVTIRYTYENRLARYTPDVIVYFKPEFYRNPLLVEIKYAAELIDKKAILDPKFNAATKYACDNGFEFKVVTEKEIRTDYLKNIKFLTRYLQSPIDKHLVKLITEQFNHHQRLTPQQILHNSDQEINTRLLYTVWQLLANNILTCDMQQNICMTSKLWKCQN